MKWPRKAIKACQGKGGGALLLREWQRHPFSSTGLNSPCEFVLSQPQHTDPAGRDPHHSGPIELRYQKMRKILLLFLILNYVLVMLQTESVTPNSNIQI